MWNSVKYETRAMKEIKIKVITTDYLDFPCDRLVTWLHPTVAGLAPVTQEGIQRVLKINKWIV